ncbi:MAG: HlyD family efflux transporter periplasmic adaptor subunit [Geminocystis sp.]|nr:HlyD family efflux transporter periplasmic adaptor subunit [Geminocystis sp.]MCS7148795.1 HlyD family efflux transporter periplasmic adaptor subunit [Geminocystis sp.]MDW8115367.1 HlyD family efflux transporter periplasmic adaptor subunit [Geminocystis sp.]MDW8462909.1 HlyD family efflux transporter periplasmic adaptor subunit [Geminocystis sp.]
MDTQVTKKEFQQQPQVDSGERGKAIRRAMFKALRVAFGLALIGVAGYLLWNRQRYVVSRVGYLNGAVIDMYATITGTLTLKDLRPGDALKKGEVVGEIRNERNPQLETDRQNLETRLAVALARKKSLTRKLANRIQLINQFKDYKENQINLEVKYFESVVEATLAQLKEAEEALAFAKLEADRYSFLAREGVVAQNVADAAITKAEQAAKVVENKKAELRRQQAALEAVRKGLQLDSARNFSFPQIRLLDLEVEKKEIEAELLENETTITQLRREIEIINRQLALQRSAQLKAPNDTVVWSVIHKTGPLGIPISAGDPVLKLLDCKDVWATGLVSERANAKLYIGQPARVRLLDGTGREIKGTVRAIRGGVGKVQVGENVAVPPPDLVRNELAVDVTLQQLPSDLTAGNFCGVGQSVEIVLEVESNDNTSHWLGWLDSLGRNNLHHRRGGVGASP